MLTIIFCVFVVSLIFILFGKKTLSILDKENYANYSVFDSFFIGMAVIQGFLTFWAIFLPTYLVLLIVLIIIGCLLAINYRKEILRQIKAFYILAKTNRNFFISILITIVFLFIYSVILPRNYDSYLYHINAIMWNETYKTVPGLANFYDRLGFNSSMLMLSSSFSFSGIFKQNIFVINTTAVLFFSIWCLKEFFFRKDILKLIPILFLLLFSLQYFINISSPGTDLLPNLVIGYIILSILLDKDIFLNRKWVLFILPLFCITLKLSIAPIIIITIVTFIFNIKNNCSFYLKIGCLSTILIMPWLIRNVILTGYLLYPSTYFDFFNVDWKVPIENAEETKSWILSFGRIPFKHYSEILKLGIQEWSPVWWESAILKNKILYSLSVFSVIVFIAISLFSFTKLQKNKVVSFCTCLVGMLFWFFTAPDIRFGASFVILLAVFPIVLISNLKINIKLINVIGFTVFLYFLFVNFQNAINLFNEDYKKTSKALLIPTNVSKVKYRKAVPFDKFILKTPNNKVITIYSAIGDTQTFDKFPCTVNFMHKISLRGNTIEEGFKPKVK